MLKYLLFIGLFYFFKLIMLNKKIKKLLILWSIYDICNNEPKSGIAFFWQKHNQIFFWNNCILPVKKKNGVIIFTSVQMWLYVKPKFQILVPTDFLQLLFKMICLCLHVNGMLVKLNGNFACCISFQR